MRTPLMANHLTSDTFYRTLTVTSALVFCFAFVLVHIVRDDLSLWHRTLSIYAVGPAGWVLLVWNGQTDYDLGSVGMAQKAQIMVNTLWLVVYSWHLPAPGRCP